MREGQLLHLCSLNKDSRCDHMNKYDLPVLHGSSVFLSCFYFKGTPCEVLLHSLGEPHYVGKQKRVQPMFMKVFHWRMEGSN